MLAWLRKRFSPADGIVALLLPAGIAGIWCSGEILQAGQKTVLTVLFVLAGSAFLWRRVLYLLVGPVFLYDLVRTTRHGRGIAHRSLFATILLLALYLVHVSWFPDVDVAHSFERVSLGVRDAPRFAEHFFLTFFWVQYLAVLLLTPAYAAGAIAGEKERRTLVFYLSTDLRDHEIVLGMLAARLANILLFLLTGLPILGILQVMGGVDPNKVFLSYAILFLTVLSAGSISIRVSVTCLSSTEAIITSYLWILIFTPISFLFGFGLLSSSSSYDVFTIPVLAITFFFYNVVTVCSCCFYAVRLMRRLHLGTSTNLEKTLFTHALDKPDLERSGQDRSYNPVFDFLHGSPRRVSNSFSFPRRIPIRENAMLWKELGVEPNLQFLTSRSRTFWFCALLLLVTVYVLSYVYILRYEKPSDAAINVLHFFSVGPTCFVFLCIAIRASGLISREREQQTLDSLLTTPLKRSEILVAKGLGSIWSTRVVWLLLPAVWIVGLLSGQIHLSGFLLQIAAVLVFSIFFASLGLWFSMTCRTTTRATLFTLLAALVLLLGPSILLSDLETSGGPVSWQGFLLNYGLSPATILSAMSFQYGALSAGAEESFFKIVTAIAGMHFYMLLIALLWASMLQRFQREKGPPPRRIPVRD